MTPLNPRMTTTTTIRIMENTKPTKVSQPQREELERAEQRAMDANKLVDYRKKRLRNMQEGRTKVKACEGQQAQMAQEIRRAKNEAESAWGFVYELRAAIKEIEENKING